MKVVELPAYGDADVLEVVERDAPPAVPGRVRVRIHARAVNPVDGLTRSGALAPLVPDLAFPAVLGWDLAGTLLDEAPDAGSGVLPAGTRVAGFVPWFGEALGRGTYADVVVVDPAWVAPVPDALGLAQAAVLGLNGLTGAQAADLFGDVEGRTVLVTGAGGPVGATTVRTLVDRGARVLATVSSGDEQTVAALGAQVLERGDGPATVAAVRGIAPEGVDGVFDSVLLGPPLLAAVRDGGRFVSASGAVLPVAERGVAVDAVEGRPDSARLARLLQDAAAGRIPARVAAELPLADAADAQRTQAEGGLRGKLVLVS